MQPNNSHELTLSEFKGFYKSLFPPLCFFANKYLNDLDTSKDVVQEVFMKILDNQITFQSERAIKSYLYTAVKNKCVNLINSKYYGKTDYSLADIAYLSTEEFFYSSS